ncbi:unnamed protein product [Caenorhabditis brenneri]
MDFDKEHGFIDQQTAGFEGDTQGTHHNIPDVSLIDQIVFGEGSKEEEYVLEEFENQQGIEFNNGLEEVFVNNLSFSEHHQNNHVNGIESEEYQKIEYVADSGETFLDDFEASDYQQSNGINGNDIEECQEVEYATFAKKVYIDGSVQANHYQRNSTTGSNFAPPQFITVPWNYYHTSQELFLQREVNTKDKQITNLINQVSKMNEIVLKHQNQCGIKRRMMPKAPRKFTSFNEALQVWKDFIRRFPVPRDVSHLNLHLYLFDPNYNQHAPQTKRRLTNGYQLRRGFTGEHHRQTLSEKKEWDRYCRKLSYLQDKQEEAGLIRALTATEEETERKWKNAVRRAHLGF